MIVQVNNLSYAYGSRVALDKLTFGTSAGAAFGILGPNGCGKSTLFKILATLQRPSAGTVVIDGLTLNGNSMAVRGKLGIVFQSGSTDARLTVDENLTAQGNLYGLSGKTLARRVDDVLESVRLTDRRRDPAGTLSGGQRRRVEVAKALLHRPPILLMDEAAAGLDPGSRLELWQTLHALRERQGITILFTTHLMDEAENATRLLLMQKGRAVGEGTPAELKAAVSGDVVVLQARDTRLASEISAQFGVSAIEVNGEIHVETPEGHRFIAAAFDAFPGRILAASVRRPTLDDVFLKITGHGLNGRADV